MHRAFVTVTLAAGTLLAATFPAFAGGGRITLTGVIREQPCPLRDGRLDCAPGQRVDAAVRTIDAERAAGLARAGLFTYARQRDPSRSWKVVEVTYR
jgi:type 1 fimbria pilin